MIASVMRPWIAVNSGLEPPTRGQRKTGPCPRFRRSEAGLAGVAGEGFEPNLRSFRDGLQFTAIVGLTCTFVAILRPRPCMVRERLGRAGEMVRSASNVRHYGRANGGEDVE
jgi:hypothetical protein